MNEDTDSSQSQLCRGPDRVDTVMDLMEPGMACIWGFSVGRTRENKAKLLQLVGAVARLVHAMSLFEQLEELLNRNARVGGAPKGEDLPHQHPK